jgi:hypothetical protein
MKSPPFPTRHKKYYESLPRPSVQKEVLEKTPAHITQRKSRRKTTPGCPAAFDTGGKNRLKRLKD